MGIANTDAEGNSAAEKQQAASIDESGKEMESRVGTKESQSRECHSAIKDISDIERTVSSSAAAFRVEIQFDRRFAQLRTET